MSKEITKEAVIQNKKEAIKSLNKLLESYINDPSKTYLKKADLISYWIKNYVQMISFEEKFDPTKNISYKRGNVVKLNFGFNIGSEYGGLHYGIVLDNKNAHNSPVLTIIPLTSSDGIKKVHDNSVFLGNELYRALKLKYDTISKTLDDELDELSKTIDAFSELVKFADNTFNKSVSEDDPVKREKGLIETQQLLDATKKIEQLYEEKKRHNQEQQTYLDKIGDEITRMKNGSIALVNQITTVSKMRIFDPRNLKGVLAGISISPENMDKINEKVKNLYVF